jgi:pentose-5-phosphate-3-epimerase
MNPALAAEVLGRGVALSGSIITVDRDQRLEAAARLIRSDAFVHADVFGRGFERADGASGDLVRELATLWPARLDVHVMADDALDVITELELGKPIARITVHARQDRPDDGLRAAVGEAAEQFWLSLDVAEWSADSVAALLAREQPHGVLQMLVPAGVPGHSADLSKVGQPAWDVARLYGPLGVDGGVTAEEIDQLVAAGVSYFVLGRSLLGS